MCEHNETLQRARYELDIMLGKGLIDLGKLKQLLSQQHEHGGIE